MIKINEKTDCCGCTACANSCPVQCIEIQQDEEGFLYPNVNEIKCINCGTCENVCPVKKDTPSGDIIDAYVVQDIRKNIRESSSSGGGFTAIAEFIISNNGAVYGAAFDENYSVHHVGVRTFEELSRFRGSKYVQSTMDSVYLQIQNKLSIGEWVLFSGTPCQVSGLKSYLKKEWDKLITVDIACHGVPSPKLWEKYKEWWRKYKKCNFIKVEFRSKKYGYSGSTMRLMFENGSEYSREPLLQFYKNTMFAGLSMRPSCHKCHFKSKKRVSDFTIFDCWDVNEFCPEMDDDRGTTALIIQSEKGKRLISIISKNWKMKSVNPEKLICNDGDMITTSASANPLRNQFFVDLDAMTIPELNKKYFPLTIKKKLTQIFKPLFYRMGILKKIKRIAK